MKIQIILRRCSQLAIVVLFCVLPWLNISGFNEINGSLFAFELYGIPFADPVAALQAVAGGISSGIMPVAAILLGALFALLIALLLGRIFCGWICPYGLFSEMVWKLRSKFHRLHPSPKSTRTPFPAKAAILGLCLLAVMLFGIPFASFLSFPGELSLAPLPAWQQAGIYAVLSFCIAPVFVLLLEGIFGRRIWCSLVCPQSVLLGGMAAILPKKFGGLRIAWNKGKCICGSKSPCRDACSLTLNPRKIGGPPRRDCMMCGDCINACKNYGHALNWGIKTANKN